jgi:predicted permease
MQGTMLIIACLFFLALCVLSLLLAKQTSRLLKLDNPSTKSATLASGMFNTGLAQVMLILAMPGNAFMIFPAIVITVIQHACVAIWIETADLPIVVNTESQPLRVPRNTNSKRTASSIGASNF